VIQRGNNRQPILFDEADYWHLWEYLSTAAAKFRCDVHAYCLMPNHFHLLLTPWQEDGIGKLMQFVGRYYVQYFNRRYDRTGTLWEGRYRATLLDPNAYLFPCSHYVEQNPIRDATNKAWVLGDDAFCQELEGRINRRTSPQPRGGDRRSAAYRVNQSNATP